MKLGVLVAILFLTTVHICAQGNEIVRVTSVAVSGSGTVFGGRPEEGFALKDVLVSSCDATFARCSDAARTDANGIYTLPTELANRRRLYLKFTSPGFDLVEVSIEIRRGAPKLQVHLPLGT